MKLSKKTELLCIMTPKAVKIWAYTSHCGFAELPVMAKDINMSMNTIRKGVKELIKNGLVIDNRTIETNTYANMKLVISLEH